MTDKKRGPTALGRTLVDNEVGEGSGGRGGHVKDEQEGGEVRDLSEEVCRWPNARVVRHGAAVLVDKIPGDENTR